MSRIPLDRVVLVENVDHPLNEHGKQAGLDKIFDRRPTMGRRQFELFWDSGLVVIRNPKSGHEEQVPIHMVRQMRTVASVEAGEKISGAKPLPKGSQLP